MRKGKKVAKASPNSLAFDAIQLASLKIAAEVYKSLQSQLTVSQFGVLEAIHKKGPLHQVEIARHIYKTTGNVTTVIDNLEKRGLVVRERGKEDRRYFQILLTPEGSRFIKKVLPTYEKQVEKVLGRLTPEERDDLVRLCRKLENLD
ncbi:MAG: MarR family transcriptional regulator [Desulforudis sp.]|nr:MAG: MarR family transcriptional regulator [Desulforudis sp.]